MSSIEHTRPGGADVFVERADDTPLVTVTVFARGGASADPIDLEGTHHHIAELAVRGAGSLDRHAIDAAFDRLGTGLSVNTARDHIGYSATCLHRHLDEVVGLLADVIARPHFDAAEHAKLIRETRSDLEEIRDDDGDLAARFFSKFFWPTHPYARALEGTEASLARIAEVPPGDLATTHRAALSAGRLVIAIAGHIESGTSREHAAQLLDAGTAIVDSPLVAPPAQASEPAPTTRRVFLIDKPERAQTQILIGHAGPGYASDDGPALILAEAAFGGMFSSRLMQEVRVKRGWSYDTGIYLARAKRPSWIRMSLAPSADVAVDAIELVIDLYRQLCSDGLRADELDLARRYTIGSLQLSRATARQRVHQAAVAAVHDMPTDYIETFAARLEVLEGSDVSAAIGRHLSADAMTVVVVGTASSLAPALERFGAVTVLPYRSY